MLGLRTFRAVLMICAVAVFALASVAMAETWNGGGGDDLWSTGANWGGTAPSSGSTTALIFDGTTRLTPFLDSSSFTVNSLSFPGTAGAFVLGGTRTLGDAVEGFHDVPNKIAFSGANRMLVKNTAQDVTINNELAQSSGGTLTIQVDTGTLTTNIIHGDTSRTMVKTGAGTLHVKAGGYYAGLSTVGGRWQVDDGTVILENAASWYWTGTVWQSGTARLGGYALTVGDGAGPAGSAVMKLAGSGGQLNSTPAPVINSDGVFDTQGGNYDANVTINGGTMKIGGGILYLRDGRTMDLNGDARFEGADSDSIWFYDGSTTTVDATETRAVIASRSRIIGGAAGPTFNVADKPLDDVDLEITGKLGATNVGDSQLIKNGAGTMLIHDYSYTTGQQTVNDGTLLVTGTAGGSGGSSWLVNANGTLGGDGVINSPTTVAGGALSPGLSAGTLTLTSLDFQDGSTLIWELGMNPTEYDTVDLVGSLTLGSTATIKLFNEYGVSVSPMDEFVLFNKAPAVYTTSWTFDYGTSGLSGGKIEVLDDQVVLTFGGAIPEPAGLSLVGLGLMALRRKRR